MPSIDTREGDIVRIQRRTDGMWIYCLVEAVLSPDALVAEVFDLQSAPDLAIDGIVAGRNFVIPRDRVLSVVLDAAAT